MSVGVHALTLQSNRRVDSTTAWTTNALVRLERLEFQSHCFTLLHAWYPPLIPAPRSSRFPMRVLSILVFWALVVAKVMDSSLPSWHFSSNSIIFFLITSFPVTSSLVQPSREVSSANNESSRMKLHLLLLRNALGASLGGRLPPGVHLQVRPHSWPLSDASFLRSLSALLIASAWYTLKRIGDVAHPSLSPLAGAQSSLRPSLPFTRYHVSSWRPFSRSSTLSVMPNLANIPHRRGLLVRG